jgi:hypothetical protein
MPYIILKFLFFIFTREQIRIYIQQEKTNADDLDPLSIVYAFAVFGKNLILKIFIPFFL